MGWKEKEVDKIKKDYIKKNPGAKLGANSYVKKELKKRRALIEHKGGQYEKEKNKIGRGDKEDWMDDEDKWSEFEKNTNESFEKSSKKVFTIPEMPWKK